MFARTSQRQIVAFAMKQLWDFMILLQPDLEAAATDFGRDLGSIVGKARVRSASFIAHTFGKGFKPVK